MNACSTMVSASWHIHRLVGGRCAIRRNHYDKEHGSKDFIYGIETVLEYAENLQTTDVAQEWISVDDRLPEKYAMVLIYDGDSVEPSLFFGDLGFYEADKYEANPFCGVTHWMPIPLPPKGE